KTAPPSTSLKLRCDQAPWAEASGCWTRPAATPALLTPWWGQRAESGLRCAFQRMFLRSANGFLRLTAQKSSGLIRRRARTAPFVWRGRCIRQSRRNTSTPISIPTTLTGWRTIMARRQRYGHKREERLLTSSPGLEPAELSLAQRGGSGNSTLNFAPSLSSQTRLSTDWKA